MLPRAPLQQMRSNINSRLLNGHATETARGRRCVSYFCYSLPLTDSGKISEKYDPRCIYKDRTNVGNLQTFTYFRGISRFFRSKPMYLGDMPACIVHFPHIRPQYTNLSNKLLRRNQIFFFLKRCFMFCEITPGELIFPGGPTSLCKIFLQGGDRIDSYTVNFPQMELCANSALCNPS